MKRLARRFLRPWLGPLRQLRDLQQQRAPLSLAVPAGGGYVDAVSVRQDGVVAASGWCPDLAAFERSIAIRLGGRELRAPTHAFRVPRPDVESAFPTAAGFRGAVVEWILEPQPSCRAVLIVDGREAFPFDLPAVPAVPYGHLHVYGEVLGRDGIYSFGPPVHVVSDEILYLARQLPAPILDFGCGGGALVAALRREGIEAYGLEIDDARIRGHLLDEVKPYVTLYDGSLPAPFADRQFATVTCSEVLEHIPGPQAVVAEMARVASSVLFITVPDMSAIPRGYHHGVVPWHLLESTHVNFFTQHSLTAALGPHSHEIEISRIGVRQCDRMLFYSSLVAIVSLDGKIGAST